MAAMKIKFFKKPLRCLGECSSIAKYQVNTLICVFAVVVVTSRQWTGAQSLPHSAKKSSIFNKVLLIMAIDENKNERRNAK